jgi:hypothetical protein
MGNNQILTELQEIKKLLSLTKEVLTLEEFCIYAGISKNQGYHLTSTGKVKFYRPFGKIIYFHKDEVIDFLLQNPIKQNKQITEKQANNYLQSKF